MNELMNDSSSFGLFTRARHKSAELGRVRRIEIARSAAAQRRTNDQAVVDPAATPKYWNSTT